MLSLDTTPTYTCAVISAGVTPGLPPYVDADTAVGSMALLAGDEVVTKAIVADGASEAVESTALGRPPRVSASRRDGDGRGSLHRRR